MAVTSAKNIFFVLGCFVLITMVAGRPQSTIDSQQESTMDQEVNGADIRRLYNAYNNYPSVLSPEERMYLNRLQFETLANYVQQNMPMSGLSDPVFRSPEIKRQVRYRQCYFNPISCFK